MTERPFAVTLSKRTLLAESLGTTRVPVEACAGTPTRFAQEPGAARESPPFAPWQLAQFAVKTAWTCAYDGPGQRSAPAPVAGGVVVEGP
jgi:hypothetical protein